MPSPTELLRCTALHSGPQLRHLACAKWLRACGLPALPPAQTAYRQTVPANFRDAATESPVLLVTIITETKATFVTPSQKLIALMTMSWAPFQLDSDTRPRKPGSQCVRPLQCSCSFFCNESQQLARTCTVTRAIQSMQDAHDHFTRDLLLDGAGQPSPSTPKLGRPKKANALSDAERARRYRARKKARLADLQDETVPVSSTVIDLSALPPWKRK